jgi:hypothetical protein
MKDGGKAFPVLDNARADGSGSLVCFDGGMTLRDYFAGQALAGLTRDPHFDEWSDYEKKLYAHECYAIANAMLAEREKRNGKDSD